MFPALLASRLHCPYCYRSFRHKEIRFRCSGRVGVKKRCEMKLDRVLADQMGDHEPQFPVFDADGRKSTAVHDVCAAETHYRVCPRCHSQLPVQFGQIDSRLIALVGAKNTGKTVYMTVLLHELMNDVGARIRASVLGADASTSHRFETEYQNALYDKHRLYDATQTAQQERGGRRPLVFNLTVGGRSKVRSTLLSFYDTAGEDMTSEQSIDQYVRYMTSADGIILLLDPLQLRGARPHAAADALMPDLVSAEDSPTAVLSNIIKQLQGSTGVKAGKRIEKPIAVAFTKMDALQGSLPPGSPWLRTPPSGDSFNEADSVEVHRHMQALLHEWAGRNMDEMLANSFSRYRLFGLSALGESPRLEGGGLQRVSDRGVQPHRAEDPFLWLLSEFGAIRKTVKPVGE